ncbi:uncharacterized protein LOC127699931 [Mytilus californianus]|uniref:uncharacterized protein LOC127699931 n=1 Tax=Mytilus californianus TaxID=6549 RepID=UPI002245E660|nr:uncharacterized protein LOC127699931 [Mytilus californianus]
MNATSKCGADGLEHDATILSKLSVLRQKQFWIGIGIYQKVTSWMEVLGCYQLQEQRDIFLESSTGLCLWKCNNTKYFSYKKHLQECMCLKHVKEDIYFRSKLSLDKCKKYNKSEAVLVHKVFNGDYQRSGNDDEMCMTFMCRGNQPQLYETHCMTTNISIQGLCEDGNPSLDARYWGLPYSTQLENCKKRNMLLLRSNACTNRTVWERIWTNIFRENIEVEIPGGDNNRIPVRCLSANISVTEIKDLQISQENCTSKLNWFVCKKINYYFLLS